MAPTPQCANVPFTTGCRQQLCVNRAAVRRCGRRSHWRLALPAGSWCRHRGSAPLPRSLAFGHFKSPRLVLGRLEVSPKTAVHPTCVDAHLWTLGTRQPGPSPRASGVHGALLRVAAGLLSRMSFCSENSQSELVDVLFALWKLEIRGDCAAWTDLIFPEGPRSSREPKECWWGLTPCPTCPACPEPRPWPLVH